MVVMLMIACSYTNDRHLPGFPDVYEQVLALSPEIDILEKHW